MAPYRWQRSVWAILILCTLFGACLSLFGLGGWVLAAWCRHREPRLSMLLVVVPVSADLARPLTVEAGRRGHRIDTSAAHDTTFEELDLLDRGDVHNVLRSCSTAHRPRCSSLPQSGARWPSARSIPARVDFSGQTIPCSPLRSRRAWGSWGGHGAVLSGIVASYGFLRILQLRPFEADFDGLRQIEVIARGQEADPLTPDEPVARLSYLEDRLLDLKGRALADFAEGGRKGEGLMAGIVALVNDTRRSIDRIPGGTTAGDEVAG